MRYVVVGACHLWSGFLGLGERVTEFYSLSLVKKQQYSNSK